jgi:hypothetical protein
MREASSHSRLMVMPPPVPRRRAIRTRASDWRAEGRPYLRFLEALRAPWLLTLASWLP